MARVLVAPPHLKRRQHSDKGTPSLDVDADRLAEDLRASVRGEVRFTDADRALYSTDASNYRLPPIGVVIPHDIDDVIAAVAVCRRHNAPIFARGGGTSLGGQCTNAAVMLDLAKYVNRVESIDVEHQTATVQAGIVLDTLNDAARRAGGLVFGPKPATHDHCTIGGMVGNNSCGSTAQWGGTTAQNVRRLEILTYDGVRMWVGPTSDAQYAEIVSSGGRPAEIYLALWTLARRYGDQIRQRYPDIPRRISGYNLPDLLPERGRNLARALVGSESTCVIILRAELALRPEPKHTCLLLAGYDNIADAADQVPLVNQHSPYIVEGLDNKLIDYERQRRLNVVALHDIPPAGAWLMIKTLGDSDEEATSRARQLEQALREAGGLVASTIMPDARHQREIDSVREAALGATARVPGMPDTWPGWEDSAVAPAKVGAYLRELTALLDEFGYGAASLYGHFGHGCVHTSIPFDLESAKGIAAFREFVTRAAKLVVSYGGSLSGEHGDGQARGELLPIMFGEELVGAMEEFKSIFDPGWRMNPGKVVAPNPLDGQLRLGVTWPPPSPQTQFSYPADGGFAGVPTRCFGVGECRRHDGEGVMCPSYMVTREEKHSTRGRMRLLFEMMRGEVITDSWRSKEVADSLDLCLACKGCKSDCPVSVDMATYKAEFLSHHYAGRLRPRSHYSLGWLPLLVRAAAPVPGLANAAMRVPWLVSLAGVDPKRRLPRLAAVPFTQALRHRRHRPTAPAPLGPVLLWPDTFTNAFDPQVGIGAVLALEAAGYEVIVPRQPVCCGLTWISTGQLGVAKTVLARTLAVLKPYLDQGMPVVGLEPSCTSVLRSDVLRLFPQDPTARQLQEQTATFAELLTRHDDFAPQLPRVDGTRPRALVQRHCHQHAVLGWQADEKLMARIGLDAEVLNSGCCGLAGDFGMTPEHRDVSLACAQRVLLPAVRAARPGTMTLADGFSCRTQLRDAQVGPEPLHLSQLVAAAVRSQRS